MTYAEKKAKYKSPLVSSTCWNGGHKKCKGRRGQDHRNICQCHCHVHICPRCKQPTAAAARGTLLNSAAQLEEMAKSIRIKALGVNA